MTSFVKLVQYSFLLILIFIMNMIKKMELRECLNNMSQKGNHWTGYHVMMREIRKYEQKYGIQIKKL